jgi:transketolase
MRTAFIHSLIEHARLNDRVFLVVGDLGYSVVEPFAAEFPNRFLNAGVAEQNMTGLAAGLAAEGYHVFTYSIANFPSLRCLEQIRNDICYHRLPVTIVAVGAGLAYGNLGFSHHGVHDIAALRCLPHMTIASPADPSETRAAVRILTELGGPSYLRLGKAGEPDLHSRQVTGTQPVIVAEGESPLAICATGSITAVAMEARSLLLRKGISPTVFSLPFLAPLADESLCCIWQCRNVVTIEEHVLAGGMANLLRERAPDGMKFRSLAVDSHIPFLVGSQSFLRDAHGLTAENVVKAAIEMGS